MRAIEQGRQPQALEYAHRVRALEVPPDYEGMPMLRRLLARSKAAIVHSGCVECELREAGFAGPVAKIPHGAWIPETSGPGYRERLGIDETTPLIGIFGFLKPYKRIAESLRAFRRLVRTEPRAKMILVGEPHPDFHYTRSFSRRIGAHVRVLGFRPIEEFVGYLARAICSESEVSHRRRELGYVDARARLRQGRNRFRCGFFQRIAGWYLSESPGERNRRRISVRILEFARRPSRVAPRAGPERARVGRDRVYLAQSGATLR